MAITVHIPTALRRHTEDTAKFSCSASNLDDLFSQLDTKFPALKPHLRDENGHVIGGPCVQGGLDQPLDRGVYVRRLHPVTNLRLRDDTRQPVRTQQKPVIRPNGIPMDVECQFSVNPDGPGDHACL